MDKNSLKDATMQAVIVSSGQIAKVGVETLKSAAAGLTKVVDQNLELNNQQKLSITTPEVKPTEPEPTANNPFKTRPSGPG